MSITPIILSGGNGSRLWPISNSITPKPFIKLGKNDSLFKRTILRCENKLFTSPVIVTNRRHKYIALKQAKEANCFDSKIILEPSPKNTAPAIFLAAMQLAEVNPKRLLLVLPSDHHIPNSEEFLRTVVKGVEAAKTGSVVAFGIKPTHPETGFGYIETDATENSWMRVKAFHEKPTLHLAKEFQTNENYLWNAGIFLCRADTVINMIKTHVPKIYEQLTNAFYNAVEETPYVNINSEYWLDCPSKSFDVAVMEKEKNIVCVPFISEWSDLGTLESFCSHLTLDKNNNFSMGSVVSENSKNTVIFSEDNSRPLICAGLEDMIVISTHEAVLMVSNKNLQQTEKTIQKFKRGDQKHKSNDTTIQKPWGYYKIISDGVNFKVKSLHVEPFAKLSLQSHAHRSEHWTVVTGIATVQINEKITQIFAGQSVVIGLGDKHRVSNDTLSELTIIEVQTGPILDEEDIVRFEDIYNRL